MFLSPGVEKYMNVLSRHLILTPGAGDSHSMSRCVFVQRQAAPTCVAVRRQDAPQLSAPHPPRPALAPDVTVASRLGQPSPGFSLSLLDSRAPQTRAWPFGCGEVTSLTWATVLICSVGRRQGLLRGCSRPHLTGAAHLTLLLDLRGARRRPVASPGGVSSEPPLFR